MNAIIIKDCNNLTREIWEFYMDGKLPAHIYLQSYSRNIKQSTRQHKWQRIENWDRLMQRDCTIGKPSIPYDVETAMRDQYKNIIMSAELI